MNPLLRLGKRVAGRLFPSPPEPEGVQVLEIDGVHVPLDFSQHTHRMVYRRRSFEPALTEALLSVVRPGDVFVDIGTNFGWHSLQLAVRRPGLRALHAVEPSARSLALFRRGVEANGLGDRIRTHHLALGKEPGSATLKYFAGLGLVNASIYPLADLEYEEETVEVRTLDALAASFEAPPAVIKCDVEGSELDVLRGAVGVLSGGQGAAGEPAPPPIWFLEANYETAGMAGYFPWQLIETARQHADYRGYHLRAGGIREMPHSRALRHGETLVLAVPEHHRSRWT